MNLELNKATESGTTPLISIGSLIADTVSCLSGEGLSLRFLAHSIGSSLALMTAVKSSHSDRIDEVCMIEACGNDQDWSNPFEDPPHQQEPTIPVQAQWTCMVQLHMQLHVQDARATVGQPRCEHHILHVDRSPGQVGPAHSHCIPDTMMQTEGPEGVHTRVLSCLMTSGEDAHEEVDVAVCLLLGETSRSRFAEESSEEPSEAFTGADFWRALLD